MSGFAKKAVSTIIITVIVVSSGILTTSVSAACSGWTKEPGWYTSCDWSDRCGLFDMFRGTGYHVGTKTRYCDVNGEQKKETTSFYEYVSCCS